jgi:hypothetical protein
MRLVYRILTKEKHSFIAGFLFCLVLTTFAGTVFGFYLLKNGITITIDSEEIATTVQKEVEKQAVATIPQMISQIKKTVPQAVSSEMQNKIGSASINISTFTIVLPDATVKEFEKYLQMIVTNALDRLLSSVSTLKLSNEIGKEAYHICKETLKNKFDGKVFKIKVFSFIELPINLKVL